MNALDPDMPADELRLHMGELTDQEVLTARAAIRWANSAAQVGCPCGIEPALWELCSAGTCVHCVTGRLRAQVETLREALEAIRDGKGECLHCHKPAEGPGAGIVSCGDHYNCHWTPVDAKLRATRALSAVSRDDTSEVS